jgi:putative membrane protein
MIESVGLHEEVSRMSSGIKVVLGGLGGALLVLVLLVAFDGWGFFGPGGKMGPGGMMGPNGGGMLGQGGWGTWWILGMLVPLLFLGGLIALIAWVIVDLASGGHRESTPGTTREDSAEEILRQRFARGEIDAKEYEERRRTLGGGA